MLVATPQRRRDASCLRPRRWAARHGRRWSPIRPTMAASCGSPITATSAAGKLPHRIEVRHGDELFGQIQWKQIELASSPEEKKP